MSAPFDVPRGAKRTRLPHADYAFWILGAKRGVLRDAYHAFLRVRWSIALVLIALGLVLANLVFAGIYYVIGGVKSTDATFFEMFSFSVQTMSTIGYGVEYPLSSAATSVMIAEAISGIILTALATGLVFAKFARATGRIAFTKNAVITVHEGKPTLMFRCGNERSNVIVEAQLHVSAALVTMTAEGRPFYKIHDLELVRSRMSGLRRGWTVMHVIDDKSPFYGKTAADLAKAECEIEISLTGLDDVTMSTIHTLHVYSDKAIKFGHRFADTIKPLPNGDLFLDLTQFDVLLPDEHASVAA
jgi:inward rectifier potassium channel